MKKEIDKKVDRVDAPKPQLCLIESNNSKITNTRQIYNYIEFDDWKCFYDGKYG